MTFLDNIELIENDEYHVNSIILNTDINIDDFDITHNNIYIYNNFVQQIKAYFKTNKAKLSELKQKIDTNNIEILYNYINSIAIIIDDTIPSNIVEFYVHQLLNNSVIRNELFNYYIYNYNHEYNYDNVSRVLTIKQTDLNDIKNLYKSSIIQNNNLFTGSIFKSSNLFNDKMCIKNYKKFHNTNLNYLTDKYRYIDFELQDIYFNISYSNCIYNFLVALLDNYNKADLETNLRKIISGYIIEKCAENKYYLQYYINEYRNDTKNIIFNDIEDINDLINKLNSSNHWICYTDFTIISIKYKLNILIIDDNSIINLIRNDNSEEYLFIYKKMFYNKFIYYIITDIKTIHKYYLFKESEVAEILNKVDTINENKIKLDEIEDSNINIDLENILDNNYTRQNLISNNMLDKIDIQNIINNITDTIFNLPYTDENKQKLFNVFKVKNYNKSYNKKILDKDYKVIKKLYPAYKINYKIMVPPFYHLESIWTHIRKNKKLFKYFAGIYDTSKIHVSIDTIKLVNNSNYFETHIPTKNNLEINGVLVLNKTVLQIIKNIDKYIDKGTYLNEKTLIFDPSIIDPTDIITQELDPGTLILYKDKFLYRIINYNYNIGFLVYITYTDKIYGYSNKQEMIKDIKLSLKKGTMPKYTIFGETPSIIPKTINNNIVLNRFSNLFNDTLYKDNGLFLYDNYTDFNKNAPIKYVNKNKVPQEYDPTRVFIYRYDNNTKIDNKNSYPVDLSVYDKSLPNKIIYTLYPNSTLYSLENIISIFLCFYNFQFCFIMILFITTDLVTT